MHLERLTSADVAWKSFREQYWDSAGVFKGAIIGIMATLAKQERIKISERTKAGSETARKGGKTLGRPKKYLDHGRLRDLRKSGWSLRKLATEFHISRNSGARVMKANPLQQQRPKKGRKQ